MYLYYDQSYTYVGGEPLMVELMLNFVGVNAADFQRAFAFYTDTLGVVPARRLGRIAGARYPRPAL